MTKRRSKSLMLLTAMLLMLVALAGCWDKNEIEELGYVRATVVDRNPDGGVRLLIQVPNPPAFAGGMGGITPGASISAKSFSNYVADGETVFDALRELSLQVPLQLFWGQHQHVIFTEEHARQGLVRDINFFERSAELRKGLEHVLVTPSDPNLLLDVRSPHEVNPSSRIQQIIRNQEKTSRFAVVSITEFLEMLGTRGQDPYCGIVRTVRNRALPGENVERNAPVPHYNIVLSGTACFADERLAGYLNERETRGLLWVRNEVRGGAIPVPSPSDKGLVTLEVYGGRGKIIPEIRDGMLSATFEVSNIEADIAQADIYLDFHDPRMIEELEKSLARVIESEIRDAADKAQELDSDVFGVGAAFHRAYPAEWQAMRDRWDEIFPAVAISVRVDARDSLHRIGLISNSTIKGRL